MSEKTERKSNFELLRIICMMMIFVYHYCVHGGILNVGSYTIDKLIALFLFTFGRVGVNIFILLSGYFLINCDFKIKKVLKLVFQILFYSIILALISVYRTETTLKAVNFKAYFTPLYNSVYWFATCYVVVYMFSPILNKIIKSISERDCKKIIILGLLVLSIIPAFFLKNNLIVTEFVWYIFMYFIGAEIRLKNFEFKSKKTDKLLSFGYPIVSFGIMVIIILIAKHLHIGLDLYYYCGLNSIFVFLGSIRNFYVI